MRQLLQANLISRLDKALEPFGPVRRSRAKNTVLASYAFKFDTSNAARADAALKLIASAYVESPRLYRRPFCLGIGWFSWVSASGIQLSSGSGL